MEAADAARGPDVASCRTIGDNPPMSRDLRPVYAVAGDLIVAMIVSEAATLPAVRVQSQGADAGSVPGVWCGVCWQQAVSAVYERKCRFVSGEQADSGCGLAKQSAARVQHSRPRLYFRGTEGDFRHTICSCDGPAGKVWCDNDENAR